MTVTGPWLDATRPTARSSGKETWRVTVKTGDLITGYRFPNQEAAADFAAGLANQNQEK